MNYLKNLIKTKEINSRFRINRYNKVQQEDREDEMELTEKKIKINGKDFTPWTLFASEKVGSFEDYPEYIYLSYSLYIYDAIVDPIYYSEIFHILRIAKPGDVFHIYINSPGGDLNTICSFAAAIEETEAIVVAHVDGSADSAAFCLAFMADETIFSDFSQMMTHNASLSTSPMDMANLKKYVNNSTVTYKGILEKYCSKVLTQEEINQICDEGREFHLSAKECNERLEKWREIKKKEYEEKHGHHEDDEEHEDCECDECKKNHTIVHTNDSIILA